MKTVSLLCRGPSLGYISNVPKVDHSVIVNAFHYEVEIESIHEYLSACSTVTHVLSLGAHWPNAGANNIYLLIYYKFFIRSEERDRWTHLL